MDITHDYIYHNGDNLWDFEVLSNFNYKNANHIHPLKQRDVSLLIHAAKRDSHIIGIIVFGSAVRFDCHSMSDLDILIIRDDGKLEINAPIDEVQSELDIIFSSKLGERLKNEIGQTGVLVYKKGE